MNATNAKATPEIKLLNFQPKDAEAFIAMVGDTEIKAYYAEFNDEEEVILSKFNGLNTDIPFVQYWGIFNAGGVLVGFASLKKSHSIFKTLQKLEQKKADDTNVDIEIETDGQVKRREWREKVQAPFTIDIAVHRDYRKQGIARAALNQVYQYATEAGLKEVYFEVGHDNEKSQLLIESLSAEIVTTAENHYGHDLYRLPVYVEPVPDAELLQAIKDEKNDAEKILLVKWRYIVRAIPELTPHRKLIIDLFTAIILKKGSIDFHDRHEGCSHSSFLGHHTVNISLKSRPDPITIIWSIAHEYGHLLQDPASDDEQKLYTRKNFIREEDAWKKAEEWLKEKPMFIYNWPNFTRFRHRRLEDYLPDRNFQADASDPLED
ncbi:GNAT family N-acetyltransferase [Mucilaginibacter sp. RCC_168]|uniref:GNAT family N-acetyltransferase n=1 Tax=Mucilaginibacter sp. RCC_168 TaxID=3239221 RepID=UPI003524BE08